MSEAFKQMAKQFKADVKEFVRVKKVIFKCIKALERESERRDKETDGECNRLDLEFVRAATQELLCDMEIGQHPMDIAIWCQKGVWKENERKKRSRA